MNKKLRKNKKWLIEDGLIGKNKQTTQNKTKSIYEMHIVCIS